jgi:hypothetical protein
VTSTLCWVGSLYSTRSRSFVYYPILELYTLTAQYVKRKYHLDRAIEKSLNTCLLVFSRSLKSVLGCCHLETFHLNKTYKRVNRKQNS